MKDYYEVAENVFRRRDEYEAQKEARRQNWQKVAASLSVFAVAAAFLFTAGTCYVFAVSLGIVEDTFGICDYFFTVPVTQKQQAAVENAAVALGETVTSDGISVTAQSAFTDGTTALIYLKIVAPEHIDLNQWQSIGFNIDGRGIQRGDNPNRPLGCHDLRTTCFQLDSLNGAKNEKEILLRVNTFRSPGYDYSFADGYDRYLMLEGLYVCEKTFPYTEHQISDGRWNFRIRFDDSFGNNGKEILDSPIRLNCSRALCNVEQTATVHSIIVTGLSVTLHYTYDTDAVQEPGVFGDVKVVLTDGTIIDVRRGSGLPGDNGAFITNYLATAPILVEDIDYLQIGETIIYTNQITHQGNPMIPAPEY